MSSNTATSGRSIMGMGYGQQTVSSSGTGGVFKEFDADRLTCPVWAELGRVTDKKPN